MTKLQMMKELHELFVTADEKDWDAEDFAWHIFDKLNVWAYDESWDVCDRWYADMQLEKKTEELEVLLKEMGVNPYAVIPCQLDGKCVLAAN